MRQEEIKVQPRHRYRQNWHSPANLRKLEARPVTTAEQRVSTVEGTLSEQRSQLGTTKRLTERDNSAESLHADIEDRLELIQESNQFISVPTPVPRHHVSPRQSSEAPLSNSLAVDCSNYFSDPSGRPVHLGTSSNWSFGRRVLLMSYEKVKQAPLPPDGLHFDGMSYDLGWYSKRYPSAEADHESPVLPSADHAMHLINSVKFHFGQLFHLFEEEEFIRKFTLYHEDKLTQPGLWYVHYLLILAFGKAFVVQKSKDRKPAGVEFFLLAMKHLPNLYFVVGGYIELIQIMCCAALYLHCVDFRGAAYRMIGQALRVALEDGMHTEMHSQDVNNVYAQRCRRVWWTVYVLDRQMSSLMGVPIAIADESIHAALPIFPGDPHKSEALEIHIRLSRVLGQINNSVYGAEGRLDHQFLRTTKDTLKGIAGVTDRLNSRFEIPTNGSLQGISRLSASLHLLHHQCIIVTTRPLPYGLLQIKLGQSDLNLVHALRSVSVKTLMLFCIDSAQQAIGILTTLQQQSLLESFLRSDLDVTFTSMIILLMAPVIDNSLIRDLSPWLQRGYAVLDDIISRGNMVAIKVKSELKQLEDIFSYLLAVEAGLPRRPYQPVVQSGISDQDGYFPQSTDVSSPSVSHMVLSPPLGNELQLDELFWQDGLTTQQLVDFADSIDINSFNFL